MKIVVLDSDPIFGSRSSDGSLLGAIDCPELMTLGEVELYENTIAHQVVERARHATILLTNKVTLGESEFAALPELQMVGILATGVNVVDLEAAQRHNITVCNVPGYSTASTAQHAIALLLELSNRVSLHERSCREGEWSRSPTFSYFLSPLTELANKTLGIVGLGAIGSKVAQIAQALGMNVIATTRTERPNAAFPLVTLDELLTRSDVVSIHCPLSPETHHLMNTANLEKMKKGAYLINVARGPIVDEDAVAAALMSGRLAGAAVDVLSQEPPRSNSPLLSAPNCIVTPHLAWATTEARTRLLAIAAQNVRAFLDGSAQNKVA